MVYINSTNSNSGSYYVSAGQGYYGTYFNGVVDEARLWNSTLDATTIYYNYNQIVTASHPYYSNLKLYWKFNENTGTSTADASGNGYTGTLYGGTQWVQSGAGIAGGAAPPATYTITATTSAGGTISPLVLSL